MTSLLRLSLVIALCRQQPSPSEVRTFGAPPSRVAVEAETHLVYDAVTKPESGHVGLYTRANPLAIPHAQGTELTADLAGGVIGRIVAYVWTPDGKYSVEYYRAHGELIMTAEGFSYFEERAPSGAWHNFLGLAAWERRSYFAHGRLVFAESRGKQAPAPGTSGDRLLEQGGRLTALLQRRLAGRASIVDLAHPS
jgi:hypothetical protein